MMRMRREKKKKKKKRRMWMRWMMVMRMRMGTFPTDNHEKIMVLTHNEEGVMRMMSMERIIIM
jgi:hypothetical protein